MIAFDDQKHLVETVDFDYAAVDGDQEESTPDVFPALGSKSTWKLIKGSGDQSC
jgi:hypothetical protein